MDLPLTNLQEEALWYISKFFKEGKRINRRNKLAEIGMIEIYEFLESHRKKKLNVVRIRKKERGCRKNHAPRYLIQSNYGDYKICTFMMPNGRYCDLRIYPEEESISGVHL